MKFFRLLLILSLLLVFNGLKAQQGIDYEMVVAKDGSGDFTTIMDAIDATKAFPDNRIIIHVKNGIYREKVRVPSWNPLVSIIGENIDNTIIVWDDYFHKINRGRNSTFFTATFFVGANDFYAENLTIENSAGEVGQAVALHVEGDRCVFKNCRILGNQDTYYGAGEKSRQLFLDCYIEGTTDFIFGEATVWFEKCIIKSKSNSFITAASTNKDKPFGFVFRNCEIITADGVTKVFLGRPWRKYAKTVIMKCNLGKQIAPEGWQNWNAVVDEHTVFYAEFQNTGLGSNTDKRVGWSKQLTPFEASIYYPEHVLGSWSLPYFTR